MNIFTDGARSRRRKHLAEKAVRKIRAAGITKKVGVHEGFIYKVTTDGRGWVKAPVGVYVVLMDEKGVRQFTLDSLGAAALPWFEKDLKDRYVLLPNPMPPITYANPSYLDFPDATNLFSAQVGTTDGLQNLPCLPKGFVIPEAYRDKYQWSSATPVVVPVGAELVSLNMCYERTSKHWVNASIFTHCYNPGMNDVENEVPLPSATTSCAASNGLTAGYNASRRIPVHTSAGYFGFVDWKPGWLWNTTRLLLAVYQGVAEQYSYVLELTVGGLLPAPPSGGHFLMAVHASRMTVDEVEGDLPDLTRLRGVCALHQGLVYLNYNTGHTARDFTFLRPLLKSLLEGEMFWRYFDKALELYNPPYNLRGDFVVAGAFPTTGGSGAGGAVAVADFWRVTVGGTLVPPDTTVDTNGGLLAKVDNPGQDPANWVILQSFATLDAKPDQASKDLVDLYIQKVLGSLFGWPNDSSDAASERDTVTFADNSGVVYSWTRVTDPNAVQNGWGQIYAGTRNGGFKFIHATGVSRIAMTMPTEVLTDPTLRPRILLAVGDTYTCMADRRDNTIQHLYIGSPFGAWQSIDLPADATMYAIRTVVPSDVVDDVSFIGVGKVSGEDFEYYVFFKPAGSAWVRLSPIPLTAGDVIDWVAAWDLCVIGDDALTSKMMSVSQHAVATPARSPRLR